MAKRKKRKLTAATSDRHILYENSVQEPEADCDLIDQVWKELRGRKASSVREDFCGTAVNSIEWVKRRKKNTAIGIDLDPDVLEVARRRIQKTLKLPDRKRIELIEDNVLTVKTRKVDTVAASNFSYFIFKTRDQLRGYFEACHKALVDDGLLLLDAYGGSDAFLEMEEPREQEGFTYIWDQDHYNPVTGDVINHIHFEFPDDTRIEKAFTYEWRLWTLPELRELLIEAGFKDVTVYWEGTDEDGDGNGEFTVTRTGEACEGWIAYLVAEK